MDLQTIRYATANGVATITLNRPDALNAMNVQLIDELGVVCQHVDRDDDAQVVVVAGAGERAFSVGADLKEWLTADDDRGPVEVRLWRHDGDPCDAVARIRKPTIAAIHGFALGGGLELAAACDIRICADDTRMGQTEVKWGLLPGGGGTQRLPRLIGRAAALDLILTGRMIDAAEALRMGLVHRVVPRAALRDEVDAYARLILGNSPIAVRYAKEAVLRGTEQPIEFGLAKEKDLSLLLQATDDAREGVKAFREKRQPNFRGK